MVEKDPSPNVQITPNEATFFLYDHLGNTRVAFKQEGTLPTVYNAMDYYPYGKILREFDQGTVNGDRYLTTAHERDRETGLDYRGARYYDSDVARLLSTDPWANKYPQWSTYNYVMGNPISLIDPTGKGPVLPLPTGSVILSVNVTKNDLWKMLDKTIKEFVYNGHKRYPKGANNLHDYGDYDATKTMTKDWISINSLDLFNNGSLVSQNQFRTSAEYDENFDEELKIRVSYVITEIKRELKERVLIEGNSITVVNTETKVTKTQGTSGSATTKGGGNITISTEEETTNTTGEITTDKVHTEVNGYQYEVRMMIVVGVYDTDTETYHNQIKYVDAVIGSVQRLNITKN